MFLTLTCDSYGKVTADGIPADPDAYDYQRAARDALHFAALFDRFIQNLRRFLGYDVQYFAAVEPQRRLAPHIHVAIRGTVSRAELRQVLAATYHQVWWPPTDTVRYDDAHLPVWHEASGRYLDPATGEFLPTWDEALDAIGPDDEPLHVARFGDRFDAQGVLAGSRDAGRCIGYLTKYLTKHVADCHQAHHRRPARPRRAARRRAALRAVLARPAPTGSATASSPRTPARACGPAGAPAKPTAANTSATPDAASWSPASGPARPSPTTAPTARPGSWRTLGLTGTDPARYTWEPVTPGDPDHMPPAQRLLHIVADRQTLARRTHPSQSTSQRPDSTQIFRQPGRRHDAACREPPADRLLTVAEAAEVLSTTERFPRRLIEERRIRFVRVGRHVRIPESALREFIAGRARRARHHQERGRSHDVRNDASAESGDCRPADGRRATPGRTGSIDPHPRPSPARPTLRSG